MPCCASGPPSARPLPQPLGDFSQQVIARLPRLLLIIAASAFMNVALAWGCALWAPWRTTTDDRLASHWIGWEAHEGAWTKFGETSEGGVGVRLGIVSFTSFPNATELQASYSCGTTPIIESHRDYLVVAGWPMWALRGSCYNGGVYQTPEWLSSRGSAWNTPRWLRMRTSLLGSIDAMPIPLRPIWPGFAVNTLLYAVCFSLMLRFCPSAIRRARLRKSQCPSCRYPIGVSPLCTECGRELPSRSSPDPLGDFTH